MRTYCIIEVYEVSRLLFGYAPSWVWTPSWFRSAMLDRPTFCFYAFLYICNFAVYLSSELSCFPCGYLIWLDGLLILHWSHS